MSVRAIVGVLVAIACAGLGYAAHVALRGVELAAQVEGVRHVLLAPEMLAVLAVLPLLLWGAARSLVNLPRAQHWLSACMRALLLVTLAIALARPAREYDATRVAAVVLVDVSESVSDAALALARSFVERARAVVGNKALRVVTFAAEPRAEDGSSQAATQLARHGEAQGGSARTDIQRALQLAYGLFPPGHLRRVAVLSDGRETHGNLLEEAARAAALGVRVDAWPLTADAAPDIAVSSLRAPDDIRVGETFEVQAEVYATVASRARLRLYQGSLLNPLDGMRELDLAKGATKVAFRSVVRTAGLVPYRLTVEPLGDDRFDANNSAVTTAVVPGPPRVLLVVTDMTQGRHLARALGAAEYEVDVRTTAGFPQSLAELSAYDFVALANVAAERVSIAQTDLVERYVRDVGGGFLMLGGDRGYALGGWQGTRMEELLPVRMDTQRRRDEHSLALALVIDCSGSMAGQKIELAKAAARAAAELLGADDSLAVIGFAGSPERTVRMQSARHRLRILQQIGGLTARGGTAIFPAVDAAFQDLSAVQARVKHVILLTDGQTREVGIEDLVQAMRVEGITVSTVGLGDDVNRNLLQRVANLGAGRAYFTDDPNNVPRIFVRETTSIGRNSAVEEPFRPIVEKPAEFLKGIPIAQSPYLFGYVATQAKPGPAQVVLRSDLGEPVLARWRVGLGWVLAWTSDVEGRWSGDWVRWPGFAPFWGQLVREHMRRDRLDELPMQAVQRGESVDVAVDAIGPDDRFLNDLRSELVVRRAGAPPGDREEERHPLPQRAPGRYEARVPLDGVGSFVIEATHRRDGRAVARSVTEVSHPFAAEYAIAEPDVDLLRRAAELTGGAVLDDAADMFQPGRERTRAHEELWPKPVLWAIAIFLLDLALRRGRLPTRSRTEPGNNRGSSAAPPRPASS